MFYGFVHALRESHLMTGFRPDETTDMTTSHLTNPAKDVGQVIGYSHATKLEKSFA